MNLNWTVGGVTVKLKGRPKEVRAELDEIIMWTTPGTDEYDDWLAARQAWDKFHRHTVQYLTKYKRSR